MRGNSHFLRSLVESVAKVVNDEVAVGGSVRSKANRAKSKDRDVGLGQVSSK